MSFLKTGLTFEEFRDVLGLSGIFMLRLLGLFMLAPVLSVHAARMDGSSAFLAGLAVGAYGLSQTLLQVPVGMLSDQLGRKPVISAGLLVYASGCVLAARSTTVAGLLVGRFIQGSGSIASVVLAMVADVTREEVRTRAMALVGMSIGLSLMLGFILGPLIAAHWGVSAIFWLIAGFDLIALVYLNAFIPEPAVHHRGTEDPRHARVVLRDRNLLSLNVLMFLLHLGMSAVFFMTPFLLEEHFAKRELWKVYGPMILLGGGLMLPAMFWAETRKKLRQLLFMGVFVAGAGYLLLGSGREHLWALVGGMIVWFVGFNLLEPALPSLVSRFAPASLRGAALGMFNMSQYMGAFAGSVVAGFLMQHAPGALYPALLLLCIPWAWAAARLDDPGLIRTAKFAAKAGSPHHPAELRRVKGVYDAHWLADGRLEMKYSAALLDEDRLRALLTDRGLL